MMTKPIQIKVDEDLPLAVAQLLRERGYRASTVVEQAMGGWKDADLWRAVQNEGKFVTIQPPPGGLGGRFDQQEHLSRPPGGG